MPRSRLPVVLAFAAVYLIWGSTYLAIRFAIETIPPFTMAGVRFVIAGGLLYAWARLSGRTRPTRSQWRAATVVGALLLLGGNGGVVVAEQWVPSGLVALLVATVPLWMVLLDARAGGARPTPSLIGGVLWGLAGVALLVGGEEIGGGSRLDLIGGGITLFASLAWAWGSLLSRGSDLPDSPRLATGMEMLAGGGLLLAAGLLTGEPARILAGPIPSARSITALAYLIVFGALIGFSAYIWLLRVSTPARVSTYAYVNPVVALLLGWALADEPLSARTLVAAAIILSAVVWIQTRGSRARTLPARGSRVDSRGVPRRAPQPEA